ncbi:hypothetical protein CK203_051888 [Vitis vinifera]|uniref:Uncharacterized protein n=1 Tax=Vitis vinifera TaxID=29760 RepID=A0A438HAR2_VITVI|nr:hypothetical protein CK203_051888 [Vitis vinifera]
MRRTMEQPSLRRPARTLCMNGTPFLPHLLVQLQRVCTQARVSRPYSMTAELDTKVCEQFIYSTSAFDFNF